MTSTVGAIVRVPEHGTMSKHVPSAIESLTSAVSVLHTWGYARITAWDGKTSVYIHQKVVYLVMCAPQNIALDSTPQGRWLRSFPRTLAQHGRHADHAPKAALPAWRNSTSFGQWRVPCAPPRPR